MSEMELKNLVHLMMQDKPHIHFLFLFPLLFLSFPPFDFDCINSFVLCC